MCVIEKHGTTFFCAGSWSKSKSQENFCGINYVLLSCCSLAMSSHYLDPGLGYEAAVCEKMSRAEKIHWPNELLRPDRLTLICVPKMYCKAVPLSARGPGHVPVSGQHTAMPPRPGGTLSLAGQGLQPAAGKKHHAGLACGAGGAKQAVLSVSISEIACNVFAPASVPVPGPGPGPGAGPQFLLAAALSNHSTALAFPLFFTTWSCVSSSCGCSCIFH